MKYLSDEPYTADDSCSDLEMFLVMCIRASACAFALSACRSAGVDGGGYADAWRKGLEGSIPCWIEIVIEKATVEERAYIDQFISWEKEPALSVLQSAMLGFWQGYAVKLQESLNALNRMEDDAR